MRLLVTNDDSIASSLLRLWVQALIADGHEVAVVAPRNEQSWTGCSKSRHRPVHSAREDHGFGCPTWVVDGTPSDCVNIGLSHLVPWTPDGVLSGINIGMNASLGFILASGTIAGAWEGALHGLPAVAASQDLTLEVFEQVRQRPGHLPPEVEENIRRSARNAARYAVKLVGEAKPQTFEVHNLNLPYPCPEVLAFQDTVPAPSLTPRLFTPADDQAHHRFAFRLGDEVPVHDAALLTDREALRRGVGSHTVLDYGRLGHARKSGSDSR
ncbi:5'/3'-nucleotidase SurE [Nibricoccus sp. IMCC34717]|uniref:5'/3'-nucleotidase SurE n=1 Tax=Nibricoccus sp. IMCC34717 TaxID=3034021 RepID=UPI00384D3E8B